MTCGSARLRLLFLCVVASGGSALALGCRQAAEGAAAQAVRAGGTRSDSVVTLSPAITEIVFALGAGDRIVARSDFTTYPPEAVRLPSCGGYTNPNLEVLAALQPELVIIQGIHSSVAEFCRARGRECLAVKLDSLDDLYTTTTQIADALGCHERGVELVGAIGRDLDGVRAAVSGLPRRTVFLSLGRQAGDLRGIMTCGGGTFLDELVAIAGGDNVFGDSAVLYPEASLEQVVARDPEVILELHPGEGLSAEQAAGIAREWLRLPSLAAVKADRVAVLTQDYLMVPGPRTGLAARALAAAVHPEAGLDGEW